MKISTALLVIAAFLVVCDIAAAQTVREVFEVEKKSFWSGTEGLYLTDQVADLLNVPNRQTGWILKSVAKLGIPFSSKNVHEIREALSRLSPGDEFKVTILRAGDVLEFTGRMR